MSQHKRIFIIGHAGSGKSLLGKALAAKLGWKQVDANLGLERYIGRPLNEIIGKQGEDSFYQCQHEILTHCLSQQNIVVTTEDSYVLNEENRKLLSSEYVVYLKVDTAEQIKRMSDGPSPLLPTDMKAFLDKLHHERDSLFEEVAKLTIESKSVEGDMKKILETLKDQ